MAGKTYILNFMLSDGSTKSVEFVAPQGPQGIQGPQGPQGGTGATGATGAAGKNGTSVTVKSVTESTEDGGENVVTFSDGKKLTVRNGRRGSDGASGGSGGGAQPDWNANEGEPGHILNRPFYKTVSTDMILENSQLVYSEDAEMLFVTDEFHLQVGNEYVVTWNGVDYTCTAFEFREDPESPAMPAVGNKYMAGLDYSEEPFFLAGLPDGFEAEDGLWGMAMDLTGATEVTVSIKGSGFAVTKIPEEYLPDAALFKYIVTFEEDSGYYYPDKPREEVLKMIKLGVDVVARVKNIGRDSFDEMSLLYKWGNDIYFSRADEVTVVTLVWYSNSSFAFMRETRINLGQKYRIPFNQGTDGVYTTPYSFSSLNYVRKDDIVACVSDADGSTYELRLIRYDYRGNEYTSFVEFSGLIGVDEVMYLRWEKSGAVTVTRKTIVDKDTIVQEVLDQLGTGVIGEVDADNNILITSTLPNGTYTMRYENADGSTTVIGTFTVSGGSDPVPDPEPDPEPTIVNLADPTSADWLTNKRINSQGDLKDVSDTERGSQTVVMTNYMSMNGVSKYHVKGLDIMSNLIASSNNYGRYYMYDSGKTLKINQYQPSDSALAAFISTADYDSSVVIIDVAGLKTRAGYADLTYMRLGGILPGTAEDVIITADQNIV